MENDNQNPLVPKPPTQALPTNYNPSDFSTLYKSSSGTAELKKNIILDRVFYLITALYVLAAINFRVLLYWQYGYGKIYEWVYKVLPPHSAAALSVYSLIYSYSFPVFFAIFALLVSLKKFKNINIAFVASVIAAEAFQIHSLWQGDKHLIFSNVIRIFDLRYPLFISNTYFSGSYFYDPYFYLLPICVAYTLVVIFHVGKNIITHSEQRSTFKMLLALLILVGLPVTYSTVNYIKSRPYPYQPPALNYSSVNKKQEAVEKERFTELQNGHPILPEVEDWDSYATSSEPLISYECKLTDQAAQTILSRVQKEQVYEKIIGGNQFYYSSGDIYYDMLAILPQINQNCPNDPISLVYQYPDNRVLWNKDCQLSLSTADFEKCRATAQNVADYYSKLQGVTEPVPLKTSPAKYPEIAQAADIIKRLTDWSLYTKSSTKIVVDGCGEAGPELKNLIDKINSSGLYEQNIDGNIILYSSNILADWQLAKSKIRKECSYDIAYPLYQYSGKDIWSGYCADGLTGDDAIKCYKSGLVISQYFEGLNKTK